MSMNEIVKGEMRIDTNVEKVGREYRSPEIHDLGKLEKVQGGNPGNIYDGRGNTFHFILHGPAR